MAADVRKFEREVNLKLKEFDNRIKTSFVLIRKDLDEVQKVVDNMRKFLKKKDKQYSDNDKRDEKMRVEFRRDVDDFTQQISQLKLALDTVKTLKKEIVERKDLAQIEDRIKTSFKYEVEDAKSENNNLKKVIEELNERVKALEKGYVRTKKKKFFSRKEVENLISKMEDKD